MTPEQQIAQILKTQIQSLERTISVFNVQLLNNADEFQRLVGRQGFTVETETRLKESIDILLKQPFRREIGRLKGCLVSITEAYKLSSSKG